MLPLQAYNKGKKYFEKSEENTGFYVTRSDAEAIGRSPLSKLLFKVDGVKSVKNNIKVM